MSPCPYCGGDHGADSNDGSYIVGPIGTAGSQVTVNTPGGGDGTVHVGDKT